jgi:hypothetical protein
MGSSAVVQPFSGTKSRNAHVITVLSRWSSHDRYHRSLYDAMRLDIRLWSTCGMDGAERVLYLDTLGGAEIEEIAGGSLKFDAKFRSTGKLKNRTAKLSQRYSTAVTTPTHQCISSLYYSCASRSKYPDETGSGRHCTVYPVTSGTHL